MNEHDAIARIKRLSHNINCADEITEVIERLIAERDEAKKEIKSLENLLEDYRDDLNAYQWREDNL